MKTLKNQIKENDKSINPLAYVKALEAAATSSGITIDGDLRLERMQLVLNVAHDFKTEQYIKDLQDRIIALNNFRGSQGSKPQGFDVLVTELQYTLLRYLVALGFGWAQLAEVSYLFDWNDLEDNDLLDLRSE